jgi:hypothetical protein
MRLVALSFILAAGILTAGLAATAAQAQDVASVESVTVNGTREREAARALVKGLAAAAPVSGKLTRWRDGVCPVTVGLRQEAVAFINDRLRAVAAQVGAPVNPDAACTPNIEIVFTTTPQQLLDNVRKERPQLLGYAGSQAKVDALAVVHRPIQAWYTTQTRDLYGSKVIDLAHHKGLPQPGLPPDAVAFASTGWRFGNGQTSDFYHVVIAADPTRLTDYPIGQLADYIALLALSHVDTPDSCQPLSSISNLLATGCANVPDGLSAADLAYLDGLYRRMNGGINASLQRGAIAAAIEEGLRQGQGTSDEN